MQAGKDGAMNDFDVLMWGLILAGGVLALLAVTARRMTPKDEEGKPNKTSLWHGVDQLCRMLLVGLVIVAVSMAGGLLRTGGQMRGDPAHLGLMLAFCGLCAVVIGGALLIWRPWYVVRRAAQEALADNGKFVVRPGLGVLGTSLICSVAGAAAILGGVAWKQPGDLPKMWPVYWIAAGISLFGGVYSLLPVMYVDGEQCRYRGWDLRQRRFSLGDVARCDIFCQSEKGCIPTNGVNVGDQKTLPVRQNRPAIGCVLSGIKVVLYDKGGKELGYFYGNARNLSLLLRRLEGQCKFCKAPCIPLGPK